MHVPSLIPTHMTRLPESAEGHSVCHGILPTIRVYMFAVSAMGTVRCLRTCALTSLLLCVHADVHSSAGALVSSPHK